MFKPPFNVINTTKSTFSDLLSAKVRKSRKKSREKCEFKGVLSQKLRGVGINKGGSKIKEGTKPVETICIYVLLV